MNKTYHHRLIRVLLLAVGLVFLHPSGVAARGDSLFVRAFDQDWGIGHVVELGEDLFVLSQRYHVPPARLADRNSLDFQSGLEPGGLIIIPLDGFNLLPEFTGRQKSRKLYYRVRDEKSLGALTHIAGQSQRNLQQWNKLKDNQVTPGQVIQVGAIRYDAKARPVYRSLRPSKPRPPEPPAPDSQVVRAKKNDSLRLLATDSIRRKMAIPLFGEFQKETLRETVMDHQKGKAVFFGNEGRPSSSKTLFAFHNDLPKGRVIRVFNPGTGGEVYVKVLGPIPRTQRYADAIIGISSSAKKWLGIQDDKAWVELYFAPL